MKFDKVEIQELFDEYEFNLDAGIEHLDTVYKRIRAGRANPYLLDPIRVDYYGTPTKINQLANITVPEARMLVISVWDSSALKLVEKAILAANIGVTPNNDGKVLRLIFPELTAERRQSLVKEVKTMAEETRVGLRNHRRTINDAIKKFKKDSFISEDEQSIYEKEVDKMLSTKLEQVDKIYQEKEKEITSI